MSAFWIGAAIGPKLPGPLADAAARLRCRATNLAGSPPSRRLGVGAAADRVEEGVMEAGTEAVNAVAVNRPLVLA